MSLSMQLTPPEMPHGFRGLPMALAVALIILALIRYGTSNAAVNGGEKPWRWAGGWWAVEKCSARLFSC
jgi:hypothetical protein